MKIMQKVLWFSKINDYFANDTVNRHIKYSHKIAFGILISKMFVIYFGYN